MSYTFLMRKRAGCIHPGNENIQNCLTGTCRIPAARVRSLASRWNPIYHNYMDACLYWSRVNQAGLDSELQKQLSEQQTPAQGRLLRFGPHGRSARVSWWCISLRAVGRFRSHGNLTKRQRRWTFSDFHKLQSLCCKLLCEAIKNVLNT